MLLEAAARVTANKRLLPQTESVEAKDAADSGGGKERERVGELGVGSVLPCAHTHGRRNLHVRQTVLVSSIDDEPGEIR